MKDNPNKYGGVTPSSPHWPEIHQAYEYYFQEVCAKPTASEFVDAMAQVYATSMSMPDLNAAVAFYSTDAGRRLTESNGQISAKVYELVQEAQAKGIPSAVVTLDRRLDEIARVDRSERCSRWDLLACLGL